MNLPAQRILNVVLGSQARLQRQPPEHPVVALLLPGGVRLAESLVLNLKRLIEFFRGEDARLHQQSAQRLTGTRLLFCQACL